MGLMRRAGKLELGESAVAAAVRAGAVRLLLLAEDAGETTKIRASRMLEGRRALLVTLPYDKALLSERLGRSGCAILAATDFGLSSAFLKALAEASPDKYGALSEEMSRRADKAARRKSAGSKSGRSEPKAKQGGRKHE